MLLKDASLPPVATPTQTLHRVVERQGSSHSVPERFGRQIRPRLSEAFHCLKYGLIVLQMWISSHFRPFRQHLWCRLAPEFESPSQHFPYPSREKKLNEARSLPGTHLPMLRTATSSMMQTKVQAFRQSQSEESKTPQTREPVIYLA